MEKIIAIDLEGLPRSTPKSVKGLIRHLDEEKNEYKENFVALCNFLRERHPEIRKEYADFKLSKILEGRG